MSSRTQDDRLKAFNTIVAILSEFDEESQRHILSSVLNWLGLQEGISAQPTVQHAKADVFAMPPAHHRFSDPSQEQSPKDFILTKNPQTYTERIACLAYYLTHFRNTPHFKTLELSKLNTEAAQPKFPNASYSVRDATTAGLLVSGPKGTKQISAMGEQFVLALPDRDAAREALIRMKPRRRKKKNMQNKRAPTNRP